MIAASNRAAHEIRYAEPQVTSITPGRLGMRGGEAVTVDGKNFAPDTIVVVRGVLVSGVQIENTRRLRFTAPALASGLTTLTVQHRGGLAQRPLLIDPVVLTSLPAGHITTVAGGSTFVGDGTPAIAAAVGPGAAAVDFDGNVYIADTGNHRVRRINARTGVITTVAGSGEARFYGDGGPATAAAVNGPMGVAVDLSGNLYIADAGNSRIRKVDAATGTISTIAGTGTEAFSGEGVAATSAALNFPFGVAADSAGNILIADTFNDRVRKVAAGTRIITTVAGNGVPGFGGDGGSATSANLNGPQAVAFDLSGNLLIVDTGNHRIRKVAAGTITTIAGTGASGSGGDNGPAVNASLSSPGGIAVDLAGNILIADTDNHRIRRISSGIITTVSGGAQGFAGDNGLAASALLNFPQSVAIDGSGNIVVVDTGNLRIRLIASQDGKINTTAGTGQRGFPGDDGPATGAALNFPEGFAMDASGNLYIADNHRVRKVAASTGNITVFAGTGEAGYSGDSGPATQVQLNSPTGLAIDPAGNLLISDSNNHRILKVDAGGMLTTLAGARIAGFLDGPAASARFNTPLGLAVDSNGNIFVADGRNHRVRRIALNGPVTTVAGNGNADFTGDNGNATLAALNFPVNLALDSSGNLFIADTLNSRIRKVALAGNTITTFAGTGADDFAGDNGPAIAAAVSFPFGVVADSTGNVYIADTFNARVRRVGANGVIRTVAGTGTVLSSGDDGPATAASLFVPVGVRLDASGNLYILDSGLISRVRAIRGPLN